MYFARTDQNAGPLKRVMREYLFDATFIIAANALVGRRLSGFGLANLRHCALDGAVARLEREGIRFTYQWVGKDDVASDALIHMMKAMKLSSRVICQTCQTPKQRMLITNRTKAKRILRRSSANTGNKTINLESLYTLSIVR